jgi:DNA excision repair protein ERCC-4
MSLNDPVEIVQTIVEEDDNDDMIDRNEGEDSTKCLLQHARLPAYLAEAFQDLYEEDGLLVCARGLGIIHLIASFCRFYVDKEEGHYACVKEELRGEKQDLEVQNMLQIMMEEKLPLVFVIGLKDEERSSLISILERWGTPPHLLPMEITNESGQGKDRLHLYDRGGIFLITSRILIVDLLNHVASPAKIDGMLVAHAENVTEQSTEAFILRIFRTQKRLSAGISSSSSSSSNDSPLLQSLRYGFVKAFSDNPDSLMSGFANVDKILKSLFVRRLYLYPRFRTCVIDELEQRPPIVEEMHQQLSPSMQAMQAAIATAVKSCIREIKRSTNVIEWADTQLTLENCVTTNFDFTISRQLENYWHLMKPATKQLVHDLKQLRMLFHYLLQYDCIAFYRLIQNIKSMGASARFPSLWLLTPAAERLFTVAKERIYRIVVPNPMSKNSNQLPQLVPVLEENPKWKLLHQILSEIEEKNRDKEVRVIVMVKDERTLETVKSYLLDGREKSMNLRWLRYLKQINDRSRSLAKSSGGSSALSEESRLLLEEEGRIRNLLFGTESKQHQFSDESKRKHDSEHRDWKKKRRKVNEEMTRGSKSSTEEQERSAVLHEALKEVEQYEDEFQKTSHSTEQEPIDVDESDSYDEEEKPYKASPLGSQRVVIQTYTSVECEESYLVLNDLRPTHVILYDADPSFIRSLELYSCCCSEKDDDPLRVYFMLFESSSEEKNYLKALEREQNAFERLIQHKKTMSLPVNMIGPWTTQEMQLAGGSAVGSYAGGTLPLSADTRTNKKRKDDEKREIAVDVREFRSALPSILHQGGMRLAPVTLTVGDFVLSNVHCVERKSISDLFGSFSSGRLHTQAEAMSKHYKVPCLLIEFDPMKTFSLQNVNEIGPDIRLDSICSKMSLLIMHFPKLRLLWSKSPHETLRIFKSLKANHEEVDVEKAVAIGSNESLDALLRSKDDPNEEENEINEAARDMLLSFPGITIHNARKIMNSCDSISELASMSREELKSMLGALTGQKLFTFFNQKG